MEVSVTVLDKKGNPVTGLTAGDFTVFDDGQPRPVAFCHFDGAPAAPAMPAAAPQPGIFSNRSEAGQELQPNVTALVLDTLNTPPELNLAVRAQLMRYLRALAPHTTVALYALRGQLTILHDFTDDAAALRAKLDGTTLGGQYGTSIRDFAPLVDQNNYLIALLGEDVMGALLAAEMDRNNVVRRSRVERSLSQLEELGTHLAGIPGRKNIIWIGAGFSMTMFGSRKDLIDLRPNVQATAQHLAQQGIVLYIANAQGVSAGADAPNMGLRGLGQSAARRAEADNADTRSAMQLLAEVTGGRYFENDNDLTTGFRQAVTDLEGSYTLGFYSAGVADDKWHRLKLRVNGPGLAVRHRRGYLASSADAANSAAWDSQRWSEAYRNPVTSTDIPLKAACERMPSGELSVTLEMDAGRIQFLPDGDSLKAELEIGMAARAASGEAFTHHAAVPVSVAAARWEETRKAGIHYRTQVNVTPNAASLRVIVHDIHGGRYGSLEIPFDRLPK